MLKELIKTKTMDKIKRNIGIILILVLNTLLLVFINTQGGVYKILMFFYILMGAELLYEFLIWLLVPDDNGVD